jgi:predicted ABC-type ATPase
MSDKPVLLVIAGPNGSGKTTVTVRLRQTSWSEGAHYINPDDIAEERYGGWNSEQAFVEAANYAQNLRETLLAERKSIAFETVFSTMEKVEFLRRAKQAGYFIRVFFVGTSHPDINANRIANRVASGGHSVPIDKILSRYEKSMINLAGAVAIADRVYFYDNSVEPRLRIRKIQPKKCDYFATSEA